MRNIFGTECYCVSSEISGKLIMIFIGLAISAPLSFVLLHEFSYVIGWISHKASVPLLFQWKGSYPCTQRTVLVRDVCSGEAEPPELHNHLDVSTQT